MARLLEPGGQGVLATDFAGTEAGAPEIAWTPDAMLETLEPRLVKERRVYFHLSREELLGIARSGLVHQYFDQVQDSAPWRWNIEFDLALKFSTLHLNSSSNCVIRT
jgi:hypothetical protein